MIAATGSRLAIAAVFLLLQTFTFATEIVLYYVNWFGRWRVPLKQVFIPVMLVVLGVVLIPTTFAHADGNPYGLANSCATGVDADIGGDGVRIAVWVQILSLILLSVLGSFHTNATGVKEIGAGLVFTHVSLTIAVLVQLGKGSLTPVDAIIGAIILDAQNIALPIQLGSKEALASRWQVGVVTATHVFGLVAIPILVSKFVGVASLDKDQCDCLTVFWWGWISNCARDASEQSIFWVYYACRCVAFCQSTAHATWNTSIFDHAEKSEKDPTSFLEDRILSGITHYHTSYDGGEAIFNEYPATVTLMYGAYGMYTLTSMATVERTISRYGLRPSSDISSVGQIIALVIAGASVARAIWLLWMLFRGEKRKGFTWWPFRVKPAILNLWAPRTWDHFRNLIEPSSIDLGFLVSDAKKADRSVLSRCEGTDRDITIKPGVSAKEPIEAKCWSPASLVSDSTAYSNWYNWGADSIEVHSFLPTQKYVQDRIKELSANDNRFEWETKCVYMIVSQEIARNLKIEGTGYPGWLVSHEISSCVVAYKVAKIMLPRQSNGEFKIIMPDMSNENLMFEQVMRLA